MLNFFRNYFLLANMKTGTYWKSYWKQFLVSFRNVETGIDVVGGSGGVVSIIYSFDTSDCQEWQSCIQEVTKNSH